jgi:hypothetical protein
MRSANEGWTQILKLLLNDPLLLYSTGTSQQKHSSAGTRPSVQSEDKSDDGSSSDENEFNGLSSEDEDSDEDEHITSWMPKVLLSTFAILIQLAFNQGRHSASPSPNPAPRADRLKRCAEPC